MIQRKIDYVKDSPAHPGFLGEGHLASALIDGSNFKQSDPFILLMDDRLDLPGGEPVGGPHPHAGFETVTLVLQGDDKEWKTGSLELMTAGSGIIHTEEISVRTRLRILQLWLVLPPEKRWIRPSWQLLPSEAVPVLENKDMKLRLYSGSSYGLVSPLQNHTPFTLAEFSLNAAAEAEQELPASYNGFVYVTEGTLYIGDREIKQGQTAWFDRPATTDVTSVRFRAGEQGAHVVLYAGEPQNAAITAHGPFIGDSPEDISRLYRDYRQGKMPHLNDLPQAQKTIYKAEKAA
ncbi:MAG: pirin family protein [Bacteroidia bacterium]|nr:pirin family protein [Bacteroidia bacterium]